MRPDHNVQKHSTRYFAVPPFIRIMPGTIVKDAITLYQPPVMSARNTVTAVNYVIKVESLLPCAYTALIADLRADVTAQS